MRTVKIEVTITCTIDLEVDDDFVNDDLDYYEEEIIGGVFEQSPHCELIEAKLIERKKKDISLFEQMAAICKPNKEVTE